MVCFLLKRPFVLLVCQGTHMLKDPTANPVQESTIVTWPRLTDLNAAFSQSIWMNKTDYYRLGSYHCQVWWHMPINPALRVLRQDNKEFQGSLHYIVGPKQLIWVDICFPQLWSLGSARSCMPALLILERVLPSSTNGHVLAVSSCDREQDNRQALCLFH